MHHWERSERLRKAASTPHAASFHHVGASLSPQMHKGTGALHESRDQGEGCGEEEAIVQRGKEEYSSRLASTQRYGGRPPMSAATAHGQVEGSVYTPHRTSPHASGELPSSTGPSTRFSDSPAAYHPRPFSLVEEDAAPNSAAATGGGGVIASPHPSAVGGVKERERDVVDSPFPSEVHCRVCGVTVFQSGWETHQLSALHQGQLRDCATARGSSSSSSRDPSARLAKVAVQGSNMLQMTTAAGSRTSQRPLISGHAQETSSSARPSARALALSERNHQGRSQAAAAAVRRSSPSPRRCRRKLDSTSSEASSSTYSASSNSTRSGSSVSTGSSSSSSNSAESKSSAARGHSGVSAVPYATPPRPAGPPSAPAALSSATPSFVLPPLSPPGFSAASSASAAARPAPLPVKPLGSADAATVVHYVEFTEEQQERRHVQMLEQQLNKYLYHRENKVLAACVRRWYESMFTKATATITDAGPPKRGGGAEVVAGAPGSSEGCAVASLSPTTARARCITVVSPSPSPVSAMARKSVEAVPHEPGTLSVPSNFTGLAVSASAADAMFLTQGSANYLHDMAKERVDEGYGGSLARRSNTRQPGSPSASSPQCGMDPQTNHSAGVGAKCAASTGVVGAPPMHSEHAGMLRASGEGESTRAPFFTTCVKSYARVHVAADGRVFPAEARRGSSDGSAENESQDLEVMQTKVSWLVRSVSRPVTARSFSSEPSDSVADGRDWKSVVGRSAAVVGAAAATASTAAPGSTYNPSQPSANSRGGETASGQARDKGAGWGDSSRAQPHHATKSERSTVSGGRSFPPGQLHAAPSTSVAGWASDSNGGDEGVESGAVAPRTQTPNEEEGHASEVHQALHAAPASGTEMISAAQAVLHTGGEDGGLDGVGRTGAERHLPEWTAGRRDGKEKSDRPDLSDSAVTAATATPSRETDTNNEEAKEMSCEPTSLTPEATVRIHAAPTRPADPLNRRSNLLDEVPPQQPSYAPAPKSTLSTRSLSSHAGALKGNHVTAASSKSPLALTGAPKELSSSATSSSLSSFHSNSISSESDIAGLVALLSPRSPQRVSQLLRPGSAASLPTHSTGAPKASACVPDTHPLHEFDLAAAVVSAVRRPINASIAGQGEPAAQTEGALEAPLRYLSDSPPPASASLIPHDAHERGAATATLSVANPLFDALTGVLGGDGSHTAVPETGVRSAVHGPHHHHNHRYSGYSRGASTAVKLPKALLALHVMNTRGVGSSFAALSADALDERVSEYDVDAAPPPLEPSTSFAVDEMRAEVGWAPSPSDHPYNVSGPTCFGSVREWCGGFSRPVEGQREEVARSGPSSSRGGRGRVGPHFFLGAKFAERKSGNDDESSVAVLPSTERYDDCFFVCTRESAATPTHKADEGGGQQGTDASEETTGLENNSNGEGALSPSATPLNGLSIPQSPVPPSPASATAVNELHTRAPIGVPPAAQALASSFAANAQAEPAVVQLPDAEICMHAVREAKWSSAIVAPSAGLAPGSDGAHSRGAAGVGPLCTTTHLHKAVSDGPDAVLPSTNCSPTASFFTSPSGVMTAAKPAGATAPNSAPAQQHLGPLRGPLQSIDQEAEERLLPLDHDLHTATLATSAAIESGGDAPLWRPSPVSGSYGAKPTCDAPQNSFQPTTAAEVAGSSAGWSDTAGASSTALVRATAQLSTSRCAAVAPCSTVDSVDASLYDLPSLEMPVLHPQGDGSGLEKGPPRLTSSRQLRYAHLSRATAAEAVAGCGNVSSSAPSALLPSVKSAECSPETFVQPPQSMLGTHSSRLSRTPRLSDAEAGICSLGGGTVACSLTQPPVATEAGALSGALAPVAVGTARTVSCLPPNVMPAAHPYCYTTLKESAGDDLRTKRGGCTSSRGSVATAPRLSFAAPLSLRAALKESVPNCASALSTVLTPLTAATAAGLGAARDASRRTSSSSSCSHLGSAGVHPHRRKLRHHRHRDESAASQERRRAERREKRRSKQRSHRDGDASPRHYRQHRHHRSDRRREENSYDKAFRSQHQCHPRPREKHRSPRHKRDRPQAEDTDAAAAPRVHPSLQCVLEAARQRRHREADFRDPHYAAQGGGTELPFGFHTPHPYWLGLPSVPVGPSASGHEVLMGGKDHDEQPAAPCSDDVTHAARQHRSHRSGNSSGAPCIRDGEEDDDAALRGPLHRRPSERERVPGHRHRCRQMPSSSLSPTSSLSSRSTGRDVSVDSGRGSEAARTGPTRRGGATAWISASPSRGGNATRGPENGGVPEVGTEKVSAPEHDRSNALEQSLKASLQQSILSIEPRRGECGAQPPFGSALESAGDHSRLTRASADVPEISGPSATAKAASDAKSDDFVRGKDACSKGICSLDTRQPPERASSERATVLELPAREDGAPFSTVSHTSNRTSLPASAPAGSASGRHVPGVQVRGSGAHESAFASSTELGNPRRFSADTATTTTGRERDATDGQPTLPQHGDLFYCDMAGRFHRVSSAELESLLADEAGRRISPQRWQSPSGSPRRPLYVVHNPTLSPSATTRWQQHRAWTITNPTDSLGCGRLNPYCSSCRAKYNLMFVDPQMRPVQWLSAQSAKLNQMGDCRTHSGYIFGGGNTASERDAMLAQQRLRAKRMAAWPELPHCDRDHLVVHEEDLDGPLRQLAAPPQGRFVPIVYKEDTRRHINPALRHRGPPAAASARQCFVFSPSSAALSQPPRHPSPAHFFGDALRFNTSSARDRTNGCPPASSPHLHHRTTRSGTCCHDSYLHNTQHGQNSSHRQHMDSGFYNTNDVGSASIIHLNKFAGVADAESGQAPPRSHQTLQAVGAAKGMVGSDAAASASASAAASGMPAEPSSVVALRREERRIKRALKQMLWRDLPQQRGTAEWECYVRSLSEGIRQQPHFALFPLPSLSAQTVETVQPTPIDGAAEP
nr:unnamed protein product [Leishmania braziliensis]